MVQSKQNEQEHTISCSSQNKNDVNNLVSGLYLYREFQSEAIRILLPITSGIEADIIENSFVAALHLGLKKKFGGRIDHLHVAQNVEPDADSGITKRYLVIYDSIPGGTGYLKQLMTDKTSLLEVLTHYAMPVLEQCSCTQKEGADGCYRCLYVYSNSRNMNTISSKKIRDFIQTLRIHSDKITPVTDLRGVKISSLVESELEARFIEALVKNGKKISNFEFRPEFYNGKAGWYLKFGESSRYFLQPQVSLGEKEDIAVFSRADFIFYPLGRMDCRPIVIFTDGFKYHKDRVALDSAQRLAIVASNKFWVWSLSYDDVQNRLDDNDALNFDISLNFPNAGMQAFAQHFSCSELVELNNQSSFIWLIQLLQVADEKIWIRYAAMMGVIWFNTIKNIGNNTHFDINLLPGYAQEKHSLLNTYTSIGNVVDSASRLSLNVSVNMQAIQQNEFDQLAVVIIFDDEKDLDSNDLYQWQIFLRLINLIQFQQNSCFFTRKGLSENVYDDLILIPQNNLHISEWEVLLADTIDDNEKSLICLLSKLDVPIPQCSFELKNSRGEIVAEAFLAWTDQKIAIIFDDFESDRILFTEAGWQVFLVSGLQSDFQHFLNIIKL
jgi:DEAD/DEAH box helicase domain-containing protein